MHVCSALWSTGTVASPNGKAGTKRLHCHLLSYLWPVSVVLQGYPLIGVDAGQKEQQHSHCCCN